MKSIEVNLLIQAVAKSVTAEKIQTAAANVGIGENKSAGDSMIFGSMDPLRMISYK